MGRLRRGGHKTTQRILRDIYLLPFICRAGLVLGLDARTSWGCLLLASRLLRASIR